MNNQLVEWIKHSNTVNTLQQVYDQLIKTGYVKSNIYEELVQVYGSKTIEEFFTALEPKLNTLYPDVKLDNKNFILIDGRVCRVLFEMKLPRVIMVDNFLSDKECRDIMELSTPRLIRSKVVDRSDPGKSKLDDVRTSAGMFFTKGENALISEIENRISIFSNWPVENQEGFQVLKYEPGQEYKPHNDYFDGNTEKNQPILKRGGQRLGTVILYLNNCPEGGGTIFPESGLELKPAKGCAVFFGYPTYNKESKTLHGGSPVIKGEKWIAVKWLRQEKFV